MGVPRRLVATAKVWFSERSRARKAEWVGALARPDAVRSVLIVGVGDRRRPIEGMVEAGPRRRSGASSRATSRSDIEVMRRYGEAFASRLQVIGHPAHLSERVRPAAVFVLTATIDCRFDQTPGSAAAAHAR